MIIEKMIIDNIGPFEHAEYSFNRNRMTLITGKNELPGMSRNGVGKSMIPDILTWIIWGKTVREMSKDEMLRDGAVKGYGTVFIKKDKYLYKITRMRGTSLQLDFIRYESGEIDKYFFGTKKTIKLTQEYINLIIGINYQTFLCTAYFGQGAPVHFLHGTSSERIDVITNFFNLNIWNNLKETANIQLKTLKTFVEVKMSRINMLKESLDVEYDDKKVQAEKTKLHELRNDNWKKIKELEYKQKKVILFNDFKNKFNNIDTNIEYIRNEEKSIIELIINENKQIEIKRESLSKLKLERKKGKYNLIDTDYEIYANTKQELENKKEDADKRKYIFSASYSTCKKNITELKKLLKNLGSYSICPLCGSTITMKHYKDINAKINKNSGHMKGWERKNHEMTTISNALSRKINRLEEKMILYRNMEFEYKQLQQQIQSLSKDVEKIKINKTKIDDLKLKNKIKIASLEKQKRFFAKKIKENRCDINFNIMNDQIKKLHAETNGITVRINLLKEKVRKYRSIKNQMAEINETIEEQRKKIYIQEYLLVNFPLIKLRIIDKINEELEYLINKYLQKFGVGIKIKLFTQVDKKSGGIIDKYDIKVKQPGQEFRLFETFSGGEKQRLSLSVYFAFQELAEKMSNAPINILILDEIFASLDNVGRETCINMLKTETMMNKNIHIITHLEDIEGFFKKSEVVTIIKNKNNVSTIRN